MIVGADEEVSLPGPSLFLQEKKSARIEQINRVLFICQNDLRLKISHDLNIKVKPGISISRDVSSCREILTVRVANDKRCFLNLRVRFVWLH